jgi:hypothetical protein
MTKGETFQVREGQTFHMFPDIDSAPKHFLCAWCRRPLGEHDRKGLEGHVEAARMALQTLEREGSAQRATDAQGWRIIRVTHVEPPSQPPRPTNPAARDQITNPYSVRGIPDRPKPLGAPYDVTIPKDGDK